MSNIMAKFNIFWVVISTDSLLNFGTSFIERKRFCRERESSNERMLLDDDNQLLDGPVSTQLALPSMDLKVSKSDHYLDRPNQVGGTLSSTNSAYLGARGSGGSDLRQGYSRRKLSLPVNILEPYDHEPAIQVDQVTEKSRIDKLVDSFKLLLEYNKFRMGRLTPILAQIIFLSLLLLKSIIYSLLASLKSKSSIAELIRNFLGHFYFIDVFSIYKNCAMYHQLQLLMILAPLMNRTRCLMLQLELARKNMNSYRRVNVISLNWAYLKNMKFTFRGWLELLVKAKNHKCEPGSCFDRPEEFAKRNSSKKLWVSDRISRIYYTNQIPFDRCFGSWNVNLSKAQEKRRPSILHWLVGLIDDRRDWFVASPAHRINLHHAFYMITIFAYLFVSFCVINTTILLARLDNCISCLRVSFLENGHESGSRVTSMDCSNIKGLQEIILIMVETFLTESLIDINICDCVMFFFSSMIHYSRTMRVVELLKGQFEIYNRHRLYKYKFSDQKLGGLKMGGSYEARPLYDFRSERDLGEMYDRSNFNSSIDYSLNLCDVLISEFVDLRKQFSFYLSMNTVSSTFSSAYSAVMILSSDSTAELIAIWGRLYTCVAPLLISLLLGVLVEFGVSS